MGTFNDEWSATNPRSEVIVSAMRNITEKLPATALVGASGLPTNNQSLGNGDIFHFSRNSLAVLGDRYFDVYKMIK